MRRTALALALASFSCAIIAAPQAQNVNVTNPVLTVEVSNADPIPVSVAVTSSSQVTHMGVPASDHVRLRLGRTTSGFSTADCPSGSSAAHIAVSSSGPGTVVFVVPAGKAFVLTDVAVLPFGVGGAYTWQEGQVVAFEVQAGLPGASFLTRAWWTAVVVDASLAISQQVWISESLTGGVVIGPGNRLCVDVGLNANFGADNADLTPDSRLYGYLVDY